MFFPEGQVRVFLYGHPVSMRLSFDGLYALTRHGLQRDPLSGNLFAFIIELQRLPQNPSQPHRSETAPALQVDRLHLHCHRFVGLSRVEQLALLQLSATTRNLSRQHLCPCPPFAIEFAQLSHRLLRHLATAPHRANKLPVDVGLAVFVSGRVAQVHPPIVSCANRLLQQLGRHYTRFCALAISTEMTPPRHCWISS